MTKSSRNFSKCFALFLFISAFAANGQNSQQPWALGFYFSNLNFAKERASVMHSPDFFERSQNSSGGRIQFGRHIAKGFRVMPSIYVIGLEQAGLKGAIAGDLGLHYSFANDYILKESSIIDPYLMLGIGAIRINDNFKANPFAGLGFTIWAFEQVGFDFQASVNSLSILEETKRDFYHLSAGLKFRLGGKDTDGDGVSDGKDKCPEEKGLKEFDGCPDDDKDKIVNSLDDCPNDSGIVALKGCPDTDGDGIANKDDACPNEKGLSSLKGCPDSDGDGVSDSEDACPSVVGESEFKGCPDTDKDGVTDASDECPSVFGLKAYKGCPDTDGDKVADSKDNCPNEVGTIANKGCPEKVIVVAEVEKTLNMSAKMIQFETGSDVISQASYNELEKLFLVINDYPSAKFMIEGHTDNAGDPTKNKVLSQKRADAVKKYLTDKSIDASRLTSTGFGDARPIASNSKPKGKAINRRVEVHLDK